MKRSICLTAMILLGVVAAFADIARPQPEKTPKPNSKKAIDTLMTIRLVEDAKEAKLIIPKSEIKALRAALDDMDSDSDSTAAVRSFSRTQTIVSGSFLSLALVFGGIWFVRSGKAVSKGGKGLVVLAVVTGIVSAATLVYANAGPPPEARSITGKMFSQSLHIYNFGSGHVKLETSDDQVGGVVLIVPNPKDKPSGEE